MIRLRLAACLLLVLLAGCATTQRDLRDARALIGQGDLEAGFARLEALAREHPDDLEVRAAHLRARELVVARLIALGNAAAAREAWEEADRRYRDVFRYDPGNARAQAQLTTLERARRHAGLLAEARSLAAQHPEETLARLRIILAENPGHEAARALLGSLTTPPEARPARLAARFQQPVTLEFREASLRAVFEILSQATGINFIFDRDVRPDLKTTVFVRNTSIEDVLDLLLTTNQLAKRVLNERTVLIYPNTPAKARDYQALTMRAFYLTNADVKQTLNMIKTLVKTRDVFVDEKLNLLVMRDTPEAIRMAERLIAAQDRAEPEVMLEVEVLEVKRNRLLDLGIQWPNQFTALNLTTQTSQTFQGGVNVVAVPTQTQNMLTVDTLRNLTGAQVAVAPNPQVNLRKEDGDAQLLANPRIRVKNREKARIHIGERVPVITTTTTANVGVSESVNYLDVGLKLDVEPNVSLDNEVSMRVNLEVSSIVREIRSQTGTLTYQVGTRNTATVLRLRDGETQVLAGLISDEDRRNASRVPGLGDLPLLGRLFASQRDEHAKTEIVLLITPRILRNVERPDRTQLEFEAGTEAVVGGASLQLREQALEATSAPQAPAVQTE